MELLRDQCAIGARRRARSRTPGSGVVRAVWLVLLTCGVASSENAGPSEEYAVKALFLYNFAKFIEWPAAMPAGAICIGILGDDPFGEVLDGAVAGKAVNGRPLLIKRLKSDPEARQCHIVFVNIADKKHVRSLLDSLKQSGVVTVSDTRGFAEAGGMINFLVVNDRVRFEINLDAASAAGLKFSSKLLSLAKIVRSAEP